MKMKKYEKPLAEVFVIRNLSFLEYFSGNGDIDQFEDGGDLGEGQDIMEESLERP